MADEVAIINAIATDLNTLALPQHTTWKYVEPRFLRVDQGKQLAIFAAGVDPEVVATQSSYENHHLINVVWAVPVFSNTESNIAPDAIASAALNEAKLIRERLESWGCELPGNPQLSAVLRKARYEINEHGMFWQAVHTLAVEAFS